MAGAVLVSAHWVRRRGPICFLLSAVCVAACGCLPLGKPPVQLWAAADLDVLTLDSPPVADNELFSAARGEIRLVAAINETLGFQLALRSTLPTGGRITIQVSDLTGAGGKLPGAKLATVYRVRDVRVERFASWYPEHTGQPASPTMFPDVLVPWDAPGAGPINLNSTSNTLAWIDLRIPPTTDPGEYTGRLIVRDVARNTDLLTQTIRLNVLPLALPSEPGLPVLCRIDPRDLLAGYLAWPREPAEETRILPGAPGSEPAVALLNATMQLFHEHRTTPILWASFPQYRPQRDCQVTIDWGPYDALVSGWLSGEAFDDLVRLSHWPIPVSLEYPNAAREGGLADARYARLLAAYLAECRRHFAERGWLDRAFVRLVPPEPLSADGVKRMERLSAILRQSETNLPLAAHLPPRSLRGLGWRNAPIIELPDVSIWAPPAMWFEPAALADERARGRQIWLTPDRPPYSGTLAIGALPADAACLPWLAYRYGVDCLWIEHAAEFGPVSDAWPAAASGAPDCLIYPGTPFGIKDRPLPSIRLKRLRRGLQDYALLQTLEQRGKRALAQTLAEQLVPWAGADACIDSLVSCKPASWPREPRTMTMARELLLQELIGTLPAQPGGQPDRLAQWGLLLNQAGRVQPQLTGVRLVQIEPGLRARGFLGVLNATEHTLNGRWQLPAPPVGWTPANTPAITLPPHSRRTAEMDFQLAGLAYNSDGVYPLTLQLATDTLGSFSVPARLAVAACPTVANPPVIDGDLSDWALATNNAAADFRLVRGTRVGATAEQADRPTLATRAFFCMDRQRLYVAVRCSLTPGEAPLCRADNTVPVDGAVPWGQDVVEILIDPRRAAEGLASDLFVLQIKPNGVLVASKGCHTEPPVAESEQWLSGAQVAVQVQRDAWIIELSLPLAALGPGACENPLWGLNVTRLEARRGEYSSWSGAHGNCYTPQSLGNLLLIRP